LRRAARYTVRTLRLPEAVRQRLPIDGTFEFELLGANFVYRSELHDGVARALFWAQADEYEAETLAVLVLILRESSTTPTILDVGANTGFYSLAALAAAPAARVHAFEPVSHIARALTANVRDNGLSDRVRINTCAVTSRSGRVALHVPDDTWGNATLSTGGFRGLSGHVENVEAVALDDYVAEHALDHVELLKIDVEGHEDEVLRGARLLLARQRPAILSECLPELDAEAVNNLLAEYDYAAYHLRGDGPVRVARVAADPSEQFKNYLLLPAERSQREWLAQRRAAV
jgi:FkbM family methyltransferase